MVQPPARKIRNPKHRGEVQNPPVPLPLSELRTFRDKEMTRPRGAIPFPHGSLGEIQSHDRIRWGKWMEMVYSPTFTIQIERFMVGKYTMDPMGMKIWETGSKSSN